MTSQTNWANLTNETITKKTRKRKSIEKSDILKVLHLSQYQASIVLGCSPSTLKRRFGEVKNELGLSRWPYRFYEMRHLPIFPKVYPMSLDFILNENMESEVLVDSVTMTSLNKSFSNAASSKQ